MSRHIITEYLSKNGIRFHHSVSTHESVKKDVLRPESHQLCEIILLLSGSVKYKVEGQYCKLSPLDAIVIQPSQLHSREIDPSVPYERMMLHFAPDLLPSLADLSLTENFIRILFYLLSQFRQTLWRNPSILRKREKLKND